MNDRYTVTLKNSRGVTVMHSDFEDKDEAETFRAEAATMAKAIGGRVECDWTEQEDENVTS